MTYPAPRQGAFAVIILISFCITLLAFVIISEQSWQKRQDEAVYFIANQIATDSSLPITINDKVSLSVLADKYLIDGTIGFVGFYAHDGAPLISVGNESNHAVQMNIQQGNSVLGSVKVTSTPISRAKIIADGWLFVLTSLVLHILLWLLYGYMARPSTRTIDDIAKTTRDRLIAQGVLEAHTPNTQTNSIKSAQNVDEYLKSKAHTADLSQTNTTQADNSAISFKEKIAQADSVVMITFDDAHNFLDLVADDLSVPYFVLCDELLERCTHQLLQLPNFAHVRMTQIDKFSKSGACVYLANTAEDGRAVLAAAVLAKMIPIANKIIYDKHRDIHKFALPMRALAANSQKAMNAKKHLLGRYNEPSQLLVDADAAKSISAVMNLIAPKKPASIHEKECRFIGDVSDTLSGQLQKIITKVFTQKPPSQS